MPLYTVAITPLLQMIKLDEAHEVRQAAFADDLSGAGKLIQLRKWWDNIVIYGLPLGYFARADKSWLIVKPNLEQSPGEIFADTDVSITTDGHKYLGGYIGSDEGKSNYIRTLWIDQLLALCEIVKFQPQAAYTAFVSGFRHRFTYHIRTIPDNQTQMQQIDSIIDTKLLPALLENHSLSRLQYLNMSTPPIIYVE